MRRVIALHHIPMRSLSGVRQREGREKRRKEKTAREKEGESESRMRLYEAGSLAVEAWPGAGGFMKRGSVRTEGQDGSGRGLGGPSGSPLGGR